MSINYPGSTDTTITLLQAADGASSNLASSLTAGATSVSLTVTGGFVNGQVITIDSEQMQITAGGGTTTLTVTRAYGGTTAATHSSGTAVNGYVVAASHNQLAAAVIALETYTPQLAGTNTFTGANTYDIHANNFILDGSAVSSAGAFLPYREKIGNNSLVLYMGGNVNATQSSQYACISAQDSAARPIMFSNGGAAYSPVVLGTNSYDGSSMLQVAGATKTTTLNVTNAGGLTLGSGVQTWTPTLSSTMTISSLVVNTATYYQIGKMVFASWDVSFTLAGTASAHVDVTNLPTPSAVANGTYPADGFILDGTGVWQPLGIAWLQYGSTTIGCYRPGQTNYTTGSGCRLVGSCTYLVS